MPIVSSEMFITDHWVWFLMLPQRQLTDLFNTAKQIPIFRVSFVYI